MKKNSDLLGKSSTKLTILTFVFLGVQLILFLLKSASFFYLLTSALFVTFLIPFLFQIPQTMSRYHHIKNKPYLEYSSESYLDELEMAKRVQEGLLSVESPMIPGIRISKRCVQAKILGGDFYSLLPKMGHAFIQKSETPGILHYHDSSHLELGIGIGDVAGHGISSALVMALSSGLISEIGKNFRSPSEILKRVNEDLLKYIENSQISHVTAFYSILNMKTRQLIYSRAGHPPAILVRKEGHYEILETKGVFLGMFKDETYEEKTCALNSGDRLFLYTDGVIETANAQKKQWGIEGLIDIILRYKEKPIEELNDAIFKEMDFFSQTPEISDDKTLLIIEIE